MGNNQSGSSLVDISDKLEIDENKGKLFSF